MTRPGLHPAKVAAMPPARRCRRILPGSLAVLGFAACGFSGPAPDRGSTLTLAALGATLGEEIREGYGHPLLFLPLVDERDGVQRGVARAWEHSPDGRAWTLRLRTDVRWEDGTPVTAGDVKFTLDVLQHPAVALQSPLTVAAPDDSTVVIEAERPLRLTDLARQAALPAHLLRHLDPESFSSWPFWDQPVGNGPYRLVRVVPVTVAEFAPSESYSGRPPRIERVLIRLGSGAGLTDLLAGNVDMMGIMTPADAIKVSADPRFSLSPMFWTEAQLSILWRNDHPLFADPRVRRALTMAIDRHTLHQVLGLPAFTPISDAIHTPGQLREGRLPDPLPYDPAAARALFAEAGWEDRDGDGILDRRGQRFSFTLLAPNMGFGTQQSAAYLQDQLRRAGIEAEILPVDYTIARQRLRNREYDAVLESALLGPGSIYRMFGGDGDNPLGYRDAEFSALAARVRGAAAADDELASYARMTEIFRRDMPVTPLYPLTAMMAVHRRVGGIGQLRWSDSNWTFDELWIEEREP
jgi:peptide/nickel transport system substrate-binding protein